MRNRDTREHLGICQWFHFRDRRTLRRSVKLLEELEVKHLRTGISWADYHRPGGRDWHDELLDALCGFEVLLSVWHTPPSLSENGACSGPPRRLLDYADFIDLVIERHRSGFCHLELWNEPNNQYKWDFQNCDPGWLKFAEMTGCAAYWAKRCGVPTVLGGMMPVDPHWLEIMSRHGVLQFTDIIGIHGFPGMWWTDHPNWDWHSHWSGWKMKIDSLRAHAAKRPVWITETGLATWSASKGRSGLHQQQCERLMETADCPAERVYWYQLIDLDPRRSAIEGYHVDEHEYHLGLVTHDGRPKPAFHLFKHLMNHERGGTHAEV
jgi:CDP-paratose 2-epimerase